MMSSSLPAPSGALSKLLLSRRTMLGVAAGALLSSLSERRVAAETQTYVARGNPARTGVIESTGPQREPESKWLLGLGVSVSAAPLIAGSTVFIGDLNGTMWAVSAEDGREIWSRKTLSPIWSSGAVGHGVLYFGNQDGYFFAVDATTGDEQWSFLTEDNIAASPLVLDDAVIVASWDNSVYSLDRSDGTERWRADVGSIVAASPTGDASRIYMPSDSHGVFALDAATGETIWHFDERSVLTATTAALADGLLFLASSAEGDVIALDAASGRLVWQAHLDDMIFPAPAVADGLVITSSEAFDRTMVHALNADSGSEAWRYEPLDFVWSDPVVAGEVVYFLDVSDSIYALRLSNGEELWRYSYQDMHGSQLNVADGSLYTGIREGVLALS